VDLPYLGKNDYFTVLKQTNIPIPVTTTLLRVMEVEKLNFPRVFKLKIREICINPFSYFIVFKLRRIFANNLKLSG